MYNLNYNFLYAAHPAAAKRAKDSYSHNIVVSLVKMKVLAGGSVLMMVISVSHLQGKK